MVWVRIDDQFAEDPKVVQVGPLGMALQVAALCYANRKLTDGFIPRPVARTLIDFEVETVDGRLHTLARTCGMVGDDLDADWVIGLMVDIGLWHEPGHDCPDCPPVDRGYYIHDYLEYQPSKDEVEEKRRQKSEAGKKGAAARWGTRNDGSSHGGRHSTRDGSRHGTRDGETMPPEPGPVPEVPQDHTPPAPPHELAPVENPGEGVEIQDQIDRTIALIERDLPDHTPSLSNGGTRKLHALIHTRIVTGGWRPRELAAEATEGRWDQVREPWAVVLNTIQALPEHRRPADIRDTYPNGDRKAAP